MRVIFELDDFCDELNCLPELIELKKEIPNLKVTLFTIPARTSEELLKEVTENYGDWIQLAVHGYTHNKPETDQLGTHEFAFLNKDQATELLNKGYNPKYYVKGFRAPGWQISEEAMEAVRDCGFWLASQFPDGRWNQPEKGQYQPDPKECVGLEFYFATPDAHGVRKVHGHTWYSEEYNVRNDINSLKEILLENKDNEFIFVENYVREIFGQSK